MRPAFVALGEALIDAVTVGLIGDDKDAAVPPGGGGDRKDCAGHKWRYRSHAAPVRQGLLLLQ